MSTWACPCSTERVSWARAFLVSPATVVAYFACAVVRFAFAVASAVCALAGSILAITSPAFTTLPTATGSSMSFPVPLKERLTVEEADTVPVEVIFSVTSPVAALAVRVTTFTVGFLTLA